MKGVEVSFLFVNDRRMKTFNAKFTGRNQTTDVLAFSQLESGRERKVGRRFPKAGPVTLLGDVIISVDAARRQAPRYGHPFEKELVLYMIHGVLHLLGYDDQARRARIRMQREEGRILGRLESELGTWRFRKPKR